MTIRYTGRSIRLNGHEEEGWDVNENAFSPGYLFAMQCRNYDDFNRRSPYSSLVSYEVLSEYGCAKWSTMPYEDLGFGGNMQQEMHAYADLEIPQGANDEARNYRCGGLTAAETLGQVIDGVGYPTIACNRIVGKHR